ncbi:metallophosphoesterase family protein [soil metagenome]
MKLHILSDLHTEFADFSPPETDAGVVILAGDIGVGTTGMEWTARTFTEQPVVYVPGNHEYYGQDIGFTNELKACAPDNVHVLQDEAVKIDGVRIAGCTLWTDFKLYGEAEAWAARRYAGRMLNDFARIRNGERRFTPEDSVGLHARSKAWLVGELAKAFDGPTVVVTHHLPAALSVAKRYSGDPLNPAFASRLEAVIEKCRPELWIHGHTHVPCDYELFGTRVVCNPRGYPGENRSAEFRHNLVVSVG